MEAQTICSGPPHVRHRRTKSRHVVPTHCSGQLSEPLLFLGTRECVCGCLGSRALDSPHVKEDRRCQRYFVRVSVRVAQTPTVEGGSGAMASMPPRARLVPAGDLFQDCRVSTGHIGGLFCSTVDVGPVAGRGGGQRRNTLVLARRKEVSYVAQWLGHLGPHPKGPRFEPKRRHHVAKCRHRGPRHRPQAFQDRARQESLRVPSLAGLACPAPHRRGGK